MLLFCWVFLGWAIGNFGLGGELWVGWKEGQSEESADASRELACAASALAASHFSYRRELYHAPPHMTPAHHCTIANVHVSSDTYADTDAEVYHPTAAQGTRSARASFANSSRRTICTIFSVHISSAWKALPFFSRIGFRPSGVPQITVIGVETRRVYWRSDRASRCISMCSRPRLRIRRMDPVSKLPEEPPRYDLVFHLGT